MSINIAYDLIKEYTGLDNVERCLQLSDHEWVFAMLDPDKEPADNDSGFYKVDTDKYQIKPFSFLELETFGTNLNSIKEIDPNLFEQQKFNQTFNL